MKVKFYKLQLQPCDARLRVYFDRDTLMQELLKEKEWKLADNLDSCEGLFIQYGTFNYAMFLPEEYNEVTTWHECLHAATRLWYDAGAELDSMMNDEVLTYTQGHIVGLIKELYKLREDN